jgi:hypothetical protein
MKKRLLFMLLLTFSPAFAADEPTVEILNNRFPISRLPESKIITHIKRLFTIGDYRAVKVQPILNSARGPSHLLVYLFKNDVHGVEFARVGVDAKFKPLSIERHYTLTDDDLSQQPGITATDAKCPDESIEFIDFAPNDDQLEPQITKDVADAAKAHNLKTIDLLKADATRQNYLNYMACPRLRGNFYDGDANPQVITTVDGTVSYTDFKGNLTGAWKFNVTNIWLACQAYNEPLLATMQKEVQAKKYAAGINDLQIGPSDKAGACAMKAAMDGKPMTASFWDCYKQFDTSSDHWGYGGDGTDFF